MLINGRIPVGKPCPFLSECKAVNQNCPKEGAFKQVPFSCAFARGFDMRDSHPNLKIENIIYSTLKDNK